MILKRYQRRTLRVVRAYLERLSEFRDRAVGLDPELGYDWARGAWERMFPDRPWSPRRNGLGEPLPSFCLKIPTGGGKTLLATKTIDLVNLHFRKRQTGLVLWIVPTTQIYQQTLGALRDRDHPYRQQLDLASAGRTLVLEKTGRFRPRDVRERLCVLLLMLPSVNRKTKAQLRVFRDRGGFEGFFPPEDDERAHERLLQRLPNLDTFAAGAGPWKRHAKSSLGNVLRLLRPLIVLDEGHKAYSVNARKTLDGFNPCLIVELSATPARAANVLVDIRGRELHAEEMIKLDLHIRNSANADWKDTLLRAVELREKLESEARSHEAETGTYIRPICLIQVERTGRRQRLPGMIHAEDAREYLLAHPGMSPEQVAVKTSQRNELKDVDDVGGLLSRDCPIRFIITKQALQEGWDCPFAYVLAILTNPGSRNALTQLVGRILRQPHARKTGVGWLDESYVFCFRRQARELLGQIRKGFGREGLGDVQGRVRIEGEEPVPTGTMTLRQRQRYRAAARDLVLPAFMIRDGDSWRPVHYEADILARIPWDEASLDPLNDLPLGAPSGAEPSITANLEEEFFSTPPASDGTASGGPIDDLFAARHLLDAVPNPWKGSEFARRVFGGLLDRHPREMVAANYVYILEELHKHLAAERDRLAEGVFRDLLDRGTMRFLVVTEKLDFTRLPETVKTARERQANRQDGGPFQRSLFDRVGESAFNTLENKVATYLDRQERLFFGYRNRARKDYFVQGWRSGRIFADFIVTLRADEPDPDDAYHRVFVLETKGLHLREAADTAYKRSVFDLLLRTRAESQLGRLRPGDAEARDSLRDRGRGGMAAASDLAARPLTHQPAAPIASTPRAGNRTPSNFAPAGLVSLRASPPSMRMNPARVSAFVVRGRGNR